MWPRAQPLQARLHENSETVAVRLYRNLTGAARALLLSGDHKCPLERQIRTCALREATESLLEYEPQFSAAHVLTQRQRRFLLALGFLLATTIMGWPATGTLLLTATVAAGYLANAVFRSWLFWVAADAAETDMQPPSELGRYPTYTVLVPLYREANVLPRLARAMRDLDYPGIR